MMARVARSQMVVSVMVTGVVKDHCVVGVPPMPPMTYSAGCEEGPAMVETMASWEPMSPSTTVRAPEAM